MSVGLLLLAAGLRLVGFQEVPPGLVRDEVLNADIVEFIINGQHALFFREGYGHEPLYHYFGVPFQILLGDNAFAIRLPSVSLGLLLVALSVPWGKRFGGAWVGWLCGLGLAIGWWPIIFSRIGLRAISLPVFLVLMSYFSTKGKPRAAGIWLGLSFYTYTAARVMLALPLLLLIDAFIFKREKRDALWMGGIATLLYLPLQMTLWLDPTLQERVDQLSGITDAALAGNLEPLFSNTIATLSVFTFSGDPLWSYANANQPIFDWATGLVFYLGLGLLFVRWRQPDSRMLLYWFGLGLVPTLITPDAPSLIRLIGILPVVYLAVGIGAEKIIDLGRNSAPLGRVAWALIPLAFGWQMVSTVTDGFIGWSQATPTIEKYGPIWRDIAADIATRQDAEIVIADGWVDPIDHDRVVRSLGENRPLRWVAVDQNVTSGAIVYPAGSTDTVFYLPEFAGLNGTLATKAGLGEPIYRSSEWPTFAIYDLAEAPPLAGEAQTFQASMTLLGWEQESFIAEGRIEVYTLWRVEQPLPADLAFFVHMRDGEALLTQHDGFDAFVPQLEIGDLILQRHLLWLPAEGDLDAAELVVGLYQRESGNRWLLDESGMDTVPLGPIAAADEAP